MIKIDFTIDDADLERGIAQAQIDAKAEGTPPDEFLANAARSGFEQYRGADKREAVARVQKFVELINGADPTQVQAMLDVLSYVEAKLAAIQGKK